MDTRTRSYQLILIALLALVASACNKEEAPCKMTLTERFYEEDAPVAKAWCPGATPTIVIPKNKPCPDEMMEAAFRMWKDKGADIAMVAEADAKNVKWRIDFEVHPDKYDTWGNTHKYFFDNAMAEATITAQECNVLMIAHEMGHSLGFGHSDDQSNLMFPYVDERTVEIPQSQIEAMALTRASAKPTK